LIVGTGNVVEDWNIVVSSMLLCTTSNYGLVVLLQ
jgi:hypothetical protein